MAERPSRAALRQAARIHDAATKLDQAVGALDLEETARALHAAEQAGRELAAAIEGLRVRAHHLLTEAGGQWNPNGVRFDGLPPIKCSWTGKTVSWDGDRAASMVAARCADQAANPVTGEVLPIAAICQLVASEIGEAMGFTASKAWRKDSLRARGIDPDLVCEESGGRATVRWL